MSVVGDLMQPVCFSGQMQNDREKVLENFNCVQLKDTEIGIPLLSRVIDGTTTGSEITAGVVDLSSFSMCSSSHLQLGSNDQLRSNHVEDWLKLTTDVHLGDYGFVKTEIGNHFLTSVIANDFENAKSDVDMCINPEESVAEIDLNVSENNSELDKNKFSNLSEFLYRTSDNCNGTLLNSFNESDSFLNYLEKTDILGKDILLENVASVDANKLSESTSNFDSASSNMEYSLTDVCPSLEKHTEVSDINIPQSALGIDKDSTSWEHLYINKHSDETAREIDYPEFNLLTFHVELCDTQDDNVAVNRTVPTDLKLNVTEKVQASEEHLPVDNIPEVSTPSVKVEQSELLKSLRVTKSPCILKAKTTVPNPRSILKSAQSVKTDSKMCSILKPSIDPKSVDQSDVQKVQSKDDNGKMKPDAKGMAFVAISTDKCKNTTEIVINTARGEQVLKGKTSDLMKATSNLWVKLEKMSSNSAGQTLTIGTVKEGIKQQTASRENAPNVENNGVRHLVIGNDWCRNFQENASNEEVAEEKTTLAALKEHGLPTEYRLCMISDVKYWLCPVDSCRKMYPRKSMVRIHVLSHYGIRPFRCDVDGCQWSFYSYFKLKRHKETHLKKKDFQCEKPGCGKKFTTIYNLNAHQKLHCRPAKIVCHVENCNASFQTKRSMEQHMKVHNIEHAQYWCPYKGCTKRYYASNTLTSHMRSHQHKEEELRCQWEGCSKLFDKPCRLRTHMRIHTGDKPYVCNFAGCGGAFQTSSKLKRHQMKHINLRKFSCTVEGCPKSFYRAEHMKEHILTHVGDRIFKCPMENCSVMFTARSSLYVHMKKHDSRAQAASQASYPCPVNPCKEVFTALTSLCQHVLKNHSPTTITTTAATPATAPDSNQLGNTGGPLQSCGEGMHLADAQPPGHEAATVVAAQPDAQQLQTEACTSYADVCTTTEDVQEDSTCRSARTHVTLSDIVREKKRTVFGTETPSSLKCENDVVLGSGALGSAHEPCASFMLQEDLPITHYFYQDEPEFQILLLDPIGSPQEFAESTINLRDLE